MPIEREELLIKPVPRQDGKLVTIVRDDPNHIELNVGMYTMTYSNETIRHLGQGNFAEGLLRAAQWGLKVPMHDLAMGGRQFPITN